MIANSKRASSVAHVALAAVAALVSVAFGATVAQAAAPVPCTSIGGGKYACNFYVAGNGISGGAPVQSGSTTVGYLHKGRNWVICQQVGGRIRSGPYFNNNWAWTLADNNRWGWVNAVYASGGDNDGPYRGVPPCNGAHGAPPGAGAPAPPPGRPVPPAHKFPPDVKSAPDRAHYDDAPSWSGGRNCTGGFTRGAKRLQDWIRYNFGPQRIGGYNCRPNTADTSKTSIHGVGRANDWFRDAGSPAQAAQVARFIRRMSANRAAMARAMGVQYWIWNRHQYTVGNSGVVRSSYGGPIPHTDHIHIEINLAGSRLQTSYWRRAARATGLQRQIDQVLQHAAPGARQTSPNEVHWARDGVTLTFFRSDQAHAARFFDCPPKYVCLWQDANGTGRRVQFFRYRTYRLSAYGMPRGTRRDASSYYNAQTGGARAYLTGRGFTYWLFAYGNLPRKINDRAGTITLVK